MGNLKQQDGGGSFDGICISGASVSQPVEGADQGGFFVCVSRKTIEKLQWILSPGGYPAFYRLSLGAEEKRLFIF